MRAESINHSIAKPTNSVKFKVGAQFVVTVKAVHEAGVNIVMPEGRGSGVILPQCWGDGASRRERLAAITPGDKIAVVVKKFFPQTTTLLLALAGGHIRPKYRGGVALKPKPTGGARASVQHKPSYEPVAPGTTFLVDGANLLGKLGSEDAANRLRTIHEELVVRGYKPAFFLECRTYAWLKHHQDSDAKVQALKQFVENAGVSLIRGESDLAMLQCARQIPDSVCVTDDAFADYRGVFSDLVGTPRIRAFSWATINGSHFLTIDGLVDAIVIKPDETPGMLDVVVGSEVSAEHEVAQPSDLGNDSPETCRRPDVPSECDTLLALGTAMLAKGNEKKGITCFAKAGATNPHVWAELAWMYADGTGVKADKSKARRFFRKAREMAAKNRQRRIRIARAHNRKNRLFDHATLRGCAA